jgi:hypothetical protein
LHQQAQPAGAMRAPGGTWANLGLYIRRQAAGPGRYILEQLVFALAAWVPTVVGVALRALLYRLILHMDGMAAIEDGVRIRYASHIWLGKGVYIDNGVYLLPVPAGFPSGMAAS